MAPERPRHTPSEAELTPLIDGLKAVRSRCRSLGHRSEEFPEAARTLDRLLRELASGRTADGSPVHYGEVARELFAIARLFESVGMLDVGSSIIEIERHLERFAPDEPPPRPPAPPPETSPAPPPPPSALGDGEDDDTQLTVRERLRPTPAIAATLALGVVAIVVCIWVVMRFDPANLRPEPTPLPPATPTPSPVPTATPRPPSEAELYEHRRLTTLLEEISAARRSLQSGDLEAAVGHLNNAATIDRTRGLVVDTAEEIVAALLDRSRGALADARWAAAESELDRARRLARRFGLDEEEADEVELALERARRFDVYRHDNALALRSKIGREGTMVLTDGRQVPVIVLGVDRSAVTVEYTEEVTTGGVVLYTRTIPWAEIERIVVLQQSD